MPKIPWKNRPDIVKRYCTCEFVHAGYAGDLTGRVYMEADGGVWVLSKVNDDCKLHGSNPDHELPEGI